MPFFLKDFAIVMVWHWPFSACLRALSQNKFLLSICNKVVVESKDFMSMVLMPKSKHQRVFAATKICLNEFFMIMTSYISKTINLDFI